MKNSRGGPLPIVIIMNVILAMLIALVVLFVVAFIKELNADSTSSNETSSLTSSEESSEDSSFDNIDGTSSFVEETSSTVSQPTYTSSVVVGESRVPDVINSVNRSCGYAISKDAAFTFGGLQDYRARTGASCETLLLSMEKPGK